MSGTQAAEALEFPWPTLPAGEPPKEIMPGLHWGRQPLASRLDHVNHWILDDGGRTALIDTGADRRESRAWWTEILQRFAPLSRVIVTHHHYDHIGVAGWLCDSNDAPLWMTRTEWMSALARMRSWTEAQQLFRLRHFTGNGLSEAQASDIQALFGAFNDRLSPIPGAFHRLIPDDLIQISGRAWTILLGEGHSPEQALFFCAEDKVLIAADQVLPSITPHIGVWQDEPDGNPLQLFMNTLDRLAGLPHDLLVLPSHGLPFIGLHARLERLRQHHRRRLDETEEACREWRTAAEVMGVLFRPPRDITDVALAFTETLAHLQYLLGTGRLEVESTATLRRFRAR